MFSLKKGGLPIAIIKGGKYDKKIIYLHDTLDEKNKIPSNPIDFLDENMFIKNRRLLNQREMNELYQAIENGHDVYDPSLKEFYKMGKKQADDKMYKEVNLTDGVLQSIPNIKTRDVLYISGMSGSGKSTQIGKFIGEYNRIFPNNKVYVFSRFTEDPALDKHDIIRIILDDTFLDDGMKDYEQKEEPKKEDEDKTLTDKKKVKKVKPKEKKEVKELKPIDLDLFSNSLVVFDDVDTITNEKVKKEVSKILDDLLECGRKKNIYMAITSHLAYNYKDTRTKINEATSYTFFKSANVYHLNRFLRDYLGIVDKKVVERIRELPSRWVTISKIHPAYVIYESGAFIL